MFVHLHVHSPYSFLDGASSIQQYLEKAAAWNMPAMALTDHHNVSGAVEFHKRAAELGIKPIQGAEIVCDDGFHLTLLAENERGYENLCRIITDSFKQNRLKPRARWETIASFHKNLLALTGCRQSSVCQAILRKQPEQARETLQKLLEVFGCENVYLEMINSYLPRTRRILEGLAELHRQTGIPMAASNNVHYAEKPQMAVHDLLVCTRTLTTTTDIHPERPLNAENYFAAPEEMQRRLGGFPEAVKNTLRIAERCSVSLPLGRRMFPSFTHSSPQKSIEFLRTLTQQGAEKRWGTPTETQVNRLEHELQIIDQLHAADYFLTVWDIVMYAKREGIRYAGRGSAADSAVAYCLGITNVDSAARGLLFERFLSPERAQNPDIDIDFDARFRDTIAEYVYDKYGTEHTASVCTFAEYRARSALRDLGRAFGFGKDELQRITKNIPHVPADGIRPALQRLPELQKHPLNEAKYQKLLDFCAAINGFPRHMGTHLGGIVISGPPLAAVTPLQLSAKNVWITQFDKTTIEDLGLIKLDLLSLRTLSAVQDAALHMENHGASYEDIPLDDPGTYELLNSGNTVGVFQLESPAQRSLQQRLRADSIEDVVASVALIRPGPIKGDMVEPFIARRHGLEPPSYIHPKLKPILAKTYGVVLYQEQVIEIASEIAGFSPGESDRLRRAMTKFRSHEDMEAIGREFTTRAVGRGIEREIAETIFSYILGYAGYGFCEAHAAAFADTAYKTAYLLQHYPAHFYAALLNQQPMGFYPPHTLINQAKQRNISILPLDISDSKRAFQATDTSIRVGLQQVKGMEKAAAEKIEILQTSHPFQSIGDFLYKTHLHRDVLENLILAGAFDRFMPNRRQLLWQLPKLLQYRQGQLFVQDSGPLLPDFTPWQRWVNEFRVLRLSPTAHIMEFYRQDLDKRGVLPTKALSETQAQRVLTAGLVIRPHRPPTKSGKTVVFLTLEDEYGLVDVTIFENVYRKCAKSLFNHSVLLVSGKLDWRDDAALSLLAENVQPLPFPPPSSQ